MSNEQQAREKTETIVLFVSCALLHKNIASRQLHECFDVMHHQRVASSASASLDSMMEQERTTYLCSDYLHLDGDGAGDDGSCCSVATIPPPKVTPADRARLVDWCYAMVDPSGFRRDTVAIAMNVVDRFAGARPCQPSVGKCGHDPLRSRAEYQLVVLTALYVAIKAHERTVLGIKDFARASKGLYSRADIQKMELQMLQTLSWRVCPPTSLQASHQILATMFNEEASTALQPGTLDFLLDEVSFQTENAVRDYYFATQRPSTVAAAAIMNVFECIDDKDGECLMESLICFLRTHSFEPFDVVLEAKHRLFQLLNEEEVEADDAISILEMSAGEPLSEEQWWNVSGEELRPGRSYVHHGAMEEILGQTVSSPRSGILDDAEDDSSCASVY